MADKKMGFDTRSVHAGAAPDPATGARSVPIYQTSSFVFDDADHAASLFNLQRPGFMYSRIANPTVAVLEERVASLENGIGATATSSGHAAQILALFPLMSPGMEIVAANKLYGGSINQMRNSFKKFGWNATFVDPVKPDNIEKALTDRTRAIFIESLANPGGIVVEVEVEGDLDLAGFLGLSETVPAGFQGVRAKVHLDTDGSPEAVQALHAHVMKTSPVGCILTKPLKVTTELA